MITQDKLEKKIPDKTYDGLTMAQWQQVIDENLFVQVRDSIDTDWFDAEGLAQFDADEEFMVELGEIWKHCRVHPTLPQFGARPDWVKDDDIIVVRYMDGYILTTLVKDLDSSVKFEDLLRWQVVKL